MLALTFYKLPQTVVGYKEKIEEWCRRFLRLDILAYYIQSQDAVKSSLQMAAMRVTDEDGNIVYGIDEDNERL